jgi:hypothetical protein
VVGWTRQILGGSFGAGDAVVESIITIPGNSATSSEERDEVWMIVKRTINGATKRYIEFLEKDYETGDTQADAFYVDCGLTYTGSATTSITGLDHLEGETLKTFVDGAIGPDVVVSGGAIELQDAGSTVQVGLPFQHKLVGLKIEGGAAAGSALGQDKAVSGIIFDVINSHTVEFGPEGGPFDKFDFREVADPMDTAVGFFTGEAFKEFDADVGVDVRWEIRSSDPTPFTLRAAISEVQTDDLV